MGKRSLGVRIEEMKDGANLSEVEHGPEKLGLQSCLD